MAKVEGFAKKVYREALPLLPEEEKWALRQQLRRAVVSIFSNIAEGHGRYYYQENVRFCYIARGSLEETLSYLAFCQEVEFTDNQVFQSLVADGEEVSRMLNGYIAYIKTAKQGANEPGAAALLEEQALYAIPASGNISEHE